MKILVSGMNGHMGKEIVKLAKDGYAGVTEIYGVDAYSDGDEPCAKSFAEAYTSPDCIIDFSHHANTYDLLDFAIKNQLPLVLATTGQTDGEKAAIISAAKEIPLFFAANYSLGVVLLIELAKKTAAVFPDAEIEIIEKHHNRKIDAPSGTALAIAEGIKEVRADATFSLGRKGIGKRTKEEIGIHAIRMGNIVGEHEVIVGTQNQTLILKHEAHSRALFAEGALSAAKFLCGKEKGLYNMKDMLVF